MQFRKDFRGTQFLNLPECHSLGNLPELSVRGLRLEDTLCRNLAAGKRSPETSQGMCSLILPFQRLDRIAGSWSVQLISTREPGEYQTRNKERIDLVLRYDIGNVQEPVWLDQAAAVAARSTPALCSYFRHRTPKPCVEFLNKVRLGHACKWLLYTRRTIRDICYESGFNIPDYFNHRS